MKAASFSLGKTPAHRLSYKWMFHHCQEILKEVNFCLVLSTCHFPLVQSLTSNFGNSEQFRNTWALTNLFCSLSG